MSLLAKLFKLTTLAILIGVVYASHSSHHFNCPNHQGIEFDSERFPGTNCFAITSCIPLDNLTKGTAMTQMENSAKEYASHKYAEDVAEHFGTFAYRVKEVHKTLKKMFSEDSNFLRKNDVEFIEKLGRDGFNVTVVNAKQHLGTGTIPGIYKIEFKVCPK